MKYYDLDLHLALDTSVVDIEDTKRPPQIDSETTTETDA